MGAVTSKGIIPGAYDLTNIKVAVDKAKRTIAGHRKINGNIEDWEHGAPNSTVYKLIEQLFALNGET